MDKWSVQDIYWNSFGIPAYNELTVPPDRTMPFIAYEAVNGSLDGVVIASASMYYKGKSWSPIMKKEIEIERLANNEIAYDGGVMKVRMPTSGFAQPMSDPNDDNIRRIRFTVEIEFLSN